MKRTRLLCGALLPVLGMVLAVPAQAHDPQLSGIRILYQQNAVLVNVTTHLSQLARAEHRATSAMTPGERDQALRRRLKVRLDGRDFTPKEVNVIQDDANDLLIWQARFPQVAATSEVLARIYPEAADSRTLVTILRDGQVVQEALLDAAHPDFRMAPASTASVEAIKLFVPRKQAESHFGKYLFLIVPGLLIGIAVCMSGTQRTRLLWRFAPTVLRTGKTLLRR